MKAALLNLQEVTYCILLPSEACSQYSLSKKLFCLVKLKKKKRVSLLAISTCKMTYWCILFLGFVCVRARGREAACSVPWHCFCTSLALASLIILLFPFPHTRSLPSPGLPLNRGAVQEQCLGRGRARTGVLFLCCLQLPLLVWCLVFSRQDLRIWGRTGEEKKVAFSTAGWEHDNEESVYVHTHAVCAAYTPTQQAQLSALTQVCQTPASGPQHTSFVLKGHINIIYILYYAVVTFYFAGTTCITRILWWKKNPTRGF